MGFSVQLALLQGRPPESALERWAGRALARLEIVRFPLLVAAGRTDADAPPFTVLFLAPLPAELEVPQLEGVERGPELPPLPREGLPEEVDPFLLSIALLAQADGVGAAFLADSSISDGGSLILPGKPALRWDADSAEEERERADGLLQVAFGARAPDLEELTWLGPGAPFWQRRLPVAARPSAGGLFRRVKKPA